MMPRKLPFTRREWLALAAALPLAGQEQAGQTLPWPASHPGDIPSGWNVLHGHPEFVHAEGMSGAHVGRLLDAFEEERARVIRSAKTPDQAQKYQAEARAMLIETIGKLPPRTPLRARLAGTLDRGEYVIEKVIFESRPRYYVTANVYVPRAARPPFPAVLASVGHWGAGKAFPDYQRLGAYFASRGFLVMVFDLPGMGERVESWDTVSRRPIVHPGTSEYFVTTEHGIAAGRTILTSGNLVTYLIWDAVRALDYLAARDDVDAARIAATGVSGGGWQTELLAAFDPRVKAAMPACYGGCIADLLFGAKISTADVDALIAPRPLLLMEATGDSRLSVMEKLRRRKLVGDFYRAAGAGDRLRFMLAEGPHGYTSSMFAVMLDWLVRWLPAPTPPAAQTAERPLQLESESELACTMTGQTVTALGGETLFSLNRTEARRLAAQWPAPRQSADLEGWRGQLRKRVLERLAMPERDQAVKSSVLDRNDRHTYSVERLVYYSEPEVYVPSLLLLPRRNGPAPAIMVVNETGKSAEGLAETHLVPLCEAGHVVFSIDPRGMGETAIARQRADYAGLAVGEDAGLFYRALRSRRTMVGMRVFDVMRAVDYLQTRPEVDSGRISAIGMGAGGPLVLFAAALENRIRRVAVSGAPVSYMAIVESRIFTHALSNFVPGALQHFDLPQAAALLAPRPLLIVNPVDGRHRRVDEEQAAGTYKFTSRVYEMAGSGEAFGLAMADTAGELLKLWSEHIRPLAGTA
ncbi:MAG TPA: acetylxylan esterase [Bryobacteraceae bacterium]|nr:acetylxylan esterase [Bryobacteraceae bacterium]